MGKPKRIPKSKKVSSLGSDDEELYNDMEEVNPKSRKFLFSEIDEFNSSREQIPLDDESDYVATKFEEEVLPLPDDSDDEDDIDDDDDRIYDNNFYSAMVQKDDIASDIEDNEDDNLANEKAWGKRKSSYYNTDYVDKDYDGFQGPDIELAEAEEKEATRIQKRLLQELSEDDFGLEWITPVDKTESRPKDLEKQKIASNLSTLSENEKLELLKKESPELLCLVKDFEDRMTELKDKILPLIPLVEDGRIPPGPGADYLTLKKKLIYMYCTNISFYLMIRYQDVNVKHHPVVKRLWTFRKLLDQLEPLAEKLELDIQAALQMLKVGKEIRPASPVKENEKIPKTKLREHEKTNGKRKVTFADENEAFSKKSVADKVKRAKMETADEKEALEMYELMKKKNQRKLLSDDDSNEDDKEKEEDEDTLQLEESLRGEDSEAANEKREITYQIAKNKGLTPHRKKEYRNPRVRHRVKFQKAKVRRKGQFKEPRKELQRYGGEVSGIRIGSKRGIKLK